MNILFGTVVILALTFGLIGYVIEKDLSKEIFSKYLGEIGEENPGDKGLPYQNIGFTVGKDLTIRGWFVNSSSEKCIILAPGKGRTRWDFLELAPSLYKAGYDLLLFDPRSTGESDGDKWGFGYLENQDILKAIDYVKETYGDRKFGALGVSTGAVAVLIAALTNPEISAVVADSPFANIKLVAEKYGNYGNNPLFKLTFPLYMYRAKQIIGVDIEKTTNLRERIKNLHTPVFFIHGKSDELIGPENSEILYANKPGEKQIWMPKGVGHGRSFESDPETYKRKVVEFFDSNI